jgi:hypothetical protein
MVHLGMHKNGKGGVLDYLLWQLLLHGLDFWHVGINLVLGITHITQDICDTSLLDNAFGAGVERELTAYYF